MVADRSIAGHCFHRLFFFFLVQAACVLHLWWRTKAKLAIVFNNFFGPPVVVVGSGQLFSPTFYPFYSLSFFPSAFHSLEETPVTEIERLAQAQVQVQRNPWAKVFH